MSQELECMCMACGISVYLRTDEVVFDDPGFGSMQMIRNVFCPECGGQLGVVGKAGEQPAYRIQ